MASSLFELLVRLTLASSGALLAVLALRLAVRRLAGAEVAYLCWLTVPLAMLAAALPQTAAARTLATVVFTRSAPGMASAAVSAPVDYAWWGVLVWACGALAALVLFGLGQFTFVRGLGQMRDQDGILFAQHARGPMLLGLWRARVVVPADFCARYTAQEQTLIIAHERMHAARRDPLANGALALLQSLFWFNPLMHYAAARCRFDQELACDAAVMAGHAGQRQAYAAAMLKTQPAGAPALATCNWQSSHPLKERLMQLKQTIPGAHRRLAGRALVTLLACAGVLSTVAVRAAVTAPAAASAQPYAITVKLDGVDGDIGLLVRAGEEIKWSWLEGKSESSAVFRVMGVSPESASLKMQINRASKVVAEPSLLLKLGQPGSVSISSEEGAPPLKMTVTVTRKAG